MAFTITILATLLVLAILIIFGSATIILRQDRKIQIVTSREQAYKEELKGYQRQELKSSIDLKI